MRVWVTLTLVLLTAGSASAQSAAQDPRPVSRPSPDFLFERPQGTFGIRGSWVLGRNGSDWYDVHPLLRELVDSHGGTGA